MSRDIMCMLRVCSQIIFNLVHLIQHKSFSSYETDVLCSFSVVGRHAHQAARAGLVLPSQSSQGKMFA